MVALVPVVASAAMVVPSIATASSSAGTDVSGVAAALAGQVDADPSEMGDVAGNDPSDVAAKGSNSTTASCPTPPAGAAAVAPAEPCAASEPPPAADATAVAGAALSVGAAAFPVSVGGGWCSTRATSSPTRCSTTPRAMTDEQIAAFMPTAGRRLHRRVLPEEPAGGTPQRSRRTSTARPTRAGSTRTRPRSSPRSPRRAGSTRRSCWSPCRRNRGC